MIEKLIVLEDIDPVIFYGVNNANIQLIKALYPKLRIVARGNVIKVLGDEEEMCAFEENITKLEKYCAEYNSLKEEVIIDIIKGNAPQAEQTGNVIVFSVTGKPIIPRSENQLKLEICMCCKLMKKCCCIVVIAMITGAVFYFLCGLKGEAIQENGYLGQKLRSKREKVKQACECMKAQGEDIAREVKFAAEYSAAR